MKVVMQMLLAASCLACSSMAQAGITGNVVIDRLLIYEGSGQGLVYIYPVGGVSSPPACHGANGDYYSFSMQRPFAKEYLALLIATHARGGRIDLYGTGDCTDQTFSETLNYLRARQ